MGMRPGCCLWAFTMGMLCGTALSIQSPHHDSGACRAARAGELLAHVLMSGAHGGRPVRLVGFSMGARLIFHCLLELARCGYGLSCPCLVHLGVCLDRSCCIWELLLWQWGGAHNAFGPVPCSGSAKVYKAMACWLRADDV